MEKEHLIIIVILGVILYMCMNKSEGFSYRYADIDFPPQGPPPPPPQPQRVRYEEKGGGIPGLRVRSSMNIMGSQHVKNHIRSDRRNNMMNSMMYGTPEGGPCNPYC